MKFQSGVGQLLYEAQTASKEMFKTPFSLTFREVSGVKSRGEVMNDFWGALKSTYASSS